MGDMLAADAATGDERPGSHGGSPEGSISRSEAPATVMPSSHAELPSMYGLGGGSSSSTMANPFRNPFRFTRGGVDAYDGDGVDHAQGDESGG
jgi:hypothetical protein